jgi:leucyl-tRNA synthetase
MDFKQIEKTAQDIWKSQKVFEFQGKSSAKKYYVLDMFPYPSGDGLHVGHTKGYTATDVMAHYMRLKGYDVLHPMGWDAFGLPAENYAIKVGKDPQEIVSKNIENFKKQMMSLGFSYDWSREINTTDPEYYKWTQWIFLQMFKKGLAYQDNVPINFCPSCKTGLANEEVVSGSCERCGAKVYKKKIRQWVLKITEYADRLLNDLEKLDWPEPIKEMQRNWIGRSEGTSMAFDIKGSNEQIKVYTTRADTLFGCTWVVLAPEHELVSKLKPKISNFKEVEDYIEKSQNKSDLERTELQKEKTGVELKGITAINPIDGREIPVWVADYVLAHYGTGAVMAVPAHDERDFDFAKKFNIDIISVVYPTGEKNIDSKEAFVEYGVLKNSGEFDGLDSESAKKKITEKLKELGHGDFAVNYKLRDWVFSRQRYWGEPIPLVHCEKCGIVPIPEEDLPVVLPQIEKYEPTGDGTSPLANETDPVIASWLNVKCPKCGAIAKRETNTMPQWAGSCWYYFRYIDPKNSEKPVSPESEKSLMPIDLYVGGAEHAVLHLLYARFWHKFLFDIGVSAHEEPFKKLINVGLILAPDRQKMSKSRGNVINPDEITKVYGVDAFRMYELFVGPFEKQAIWNKRGIVGTFNFLTNVIKSFESRDAQGKNDFSGEIAKLARDTSKKIESFNLNTIVSDFMKFTGQVDLEKMNDIAWRNFLICLSPIAPHTSEYLFCKLGEESSVFKQDWPCLNLDKSSKSAIIIQVDGKKRGLISIPSDSPEDAVRKKALGVALEKVSKEEIKKTVYIQNRVINFVTK